MARISYESLAKSTAALQAGDVPGALAVRNSERNQESGDFDDSTARTIGYILSRTPALLADCPVDMREPLRIAAAMMELWGTNRVSDFATVEGTFDYRFGTDAVAHMLHLHGSFLRAIDELRGVGITHVELIGAHGPDDCEACRAVDGMVFPISEVPELPLASCTCRDRYGCRVIVTATEYNDRGSG
jgi:hypothetical protein